MTCNMQGIADPLKRRKLFRYLHERYIDIALLQETHSTPNNERRWKNEWGGRILFDHGTSESKGVALLFNRNLKVDLKSCNKSQEGRSILIQAIINDHKIFIANIYAPNNDTPEFFSRVFAQIEETEMDIKLIGSDLNIALDDKIDHFSTSDKNRNKKSVEVVGNFLVDKELCDIWKVSNPVKKIYTWRRTKPLAMSRLDYLLIPYESLNSIEKCEIIPGIGSDHSFVEMSILLENSIRGRGYWKFNTSLLQDKKFLDEMNVLIDKSLLTHQHKTPCFKWEVLKIEMSEFA